MILISSGLPGGPLGGLLGRLGGLLGALEASWAVLEASWGHLGRLGGHLGRLGGVPSWSRLDQEKPLEPGLEEPPGTPAGHAGGPGGVHLEKNQNQNRKDLARQAPL